MRSARGRVLSPAPRQSPRAANSYAARTCSHTFAVLRPFRAGTRDPGGRCVREDLERGVLRGAVDVARIARALGREERLEADAHPGVKARLQAIRRNRVRRNAEPRQLAFGD